MQVCPHLDEGDRPLGTAGAHPPAHGELLPHPRGALVLPSLHVRHTKPPPELPHGLPRGRWGGGGRGGGLRGGAVAAPRRGGSERRRKEGERSKRRIPEAREPEWGQPEEAGGGGGRHQEGRKEAEVGDLRYRGLSASFAI